MDKLLALLLASCSSEVYADRLVDFTKLIPPPPQVIYVVPVQQFIPPTPILPSTYVAPSNDWYTPPPQRPVIDFGVNK